MTNEDHGFIDSQLKIFSSEGIVLWEDEMEENFTINIPLLNDEFKEKYNELLNLFLDFDEALYLYPFERLHMTLLGRIPKDYDVGRLVSGVESFITDKAFNFKLGFLANNNQGVSIISEPKFDLYKLRMDLREYLEINGDDYTKYSNIYEKLSWVNFMRFRSKPAREFFETLWNNKEFQFGDFVAKRVDIILNTSRTVDPSKSRIVKSISTKA